ncbi:hypothetical protein CMV30_00840 [Nibricoccus aquaticus]|uniref:Uncharacterized protein n=1 Tax=Nibricoccus aquaticus TaxID=2576891 RepID=A0A290QE65_9BACT|nr:hypothetical protein CMV30_00840 [Nibricoccus aquaticus]
MRVVAEDREEGEREGDGECVFALEEKRQREQRERPGTAADEEIERGGSGARDGRWLRDLRRAERSGAR